MNIPFVRIRIGDEEKNAVMRVLESGNLAQGPEVLAFEEAFAQYVGAKYAVAVTNGTSALHAGLYGLEVGPGDEVITTPFTFVATANAILMQGAKVVFADIGEDFLLNPAAVVEKITPRTRVLLPVDLYGQPCDYGQLEKIAKNYSLGLMVDAAQAIGAQYGTLMVGSIGKVSTFSFYATKNIMTGEGGMVTTDDEDIAKRMKRFRHHGQSAERYTYDDLGYNYRMMDLVAAIGRVQLTRVEEITEKRNWNARYYTEHLQQIPGLIVPQVQKRIRHAYHQYTIRISRDFGMSRDEFRSKLAEKGIGTSIYYPSPLHVHPHFISLGYRKGDFPVAEQLSEEVVSLPIRPDLEAGELEYVVKAIESLVPVVKVKKK